jgi:hypothetical protein
MRIVVPVVVAALAIGAAVGFGVGRHGPGGASGSSAEGEVREVDVRASRGDERLAGEVAMLKAQVAALAEHQRLGAAQGGGDAAAIAAAAIVDPKNADDGGAASRHLRALLDHVGATFRGQAMEPRWSASAAAALGRAFASPDVGLRARSVECRRTICRVELEGVGPQTSSALAKVAGPLADELPYMWADRTGDEAAGSLLLYFSREDFEPEPPNRLTGRR